MWPCGGSGRFVHDGPWVEQGIVLGQQWPLERIPPRMRELQADEQIVILADAFAMRLAGCVHQLGQGTDGRFVDHELARIGSPFGDDREASPHINLAPPAPKRR